MFGIQPQLKTALYEAVRPIVDTFELPVVLGHVCRGALSEHGSLRITSIVVRDSVGCPMRTYGGTGSPAHEAAFKKHIVHVGRSGLLLDWITAFMYRQIDLSDGTSRATEQLAVCIEDVPRPLERPPTTRALVVSRQLFNTLVPDDIAQKYYHDLYSARSKAQIGPGREKESYNVERMLGCRLRAEQMIMDCRRSAAVLDRITSWRDADFGEMRKWSFVSALQTALLFLWGSGETRPAIRGFVTAGVCLNVSNVRGNEGNPLLVVSAALPSDTNTWKECAKNILECVRDKRIETELRRLGTKDTLPHRPRIIHQRYPRLNPILVEEAITVELAQCVDHAFPGWAVSLLLWLSFVVERLRDEVHEGQSLEFCFAVGDRSEVEDSGLFDIVELRWNGDETMVPWDANGELSATFEDDVSKLLEVVRREVAQKNYAWFEEGKYALLWDLTFPDVRPQCLIRLRDSSWTVFVEQSRMRRESSLYKIVLALAFVGADGAGGIIIGGREVVSFRKHSAWESDKGRLYDEVLEEISAGVDVLDNDDVQLRESVVELLTRAVIAVSEDPHAGCMLVLSDAETEEEFRDMGSPWKTVTQDDPLSMSLDELKSLMSMDGATCVSIREGKLAVSFRRMVTGPGQAVQLTERARDGLDGQGSRKWSAAAAAFHTGVQRILAVSQDGPVYVFKRTDATPDAKVDVVPLGTGGAEA